VVEVPTFTSITPSSGPTIGGTVVTIIGTSLTGTTGVIFGGTAATGVSVVNATAVSATTPAHAAGSVWVNISNPNGNLNETGAFTYVASSTGITINETAVFMNLQPGLTATNSSLGITVSANVPFTVVVSDNTGRTGSDVGYMGNYTTSYVASPLDTVLAYPFKLAGTTNSTTAAWTITGPPTTGSTLYSGSAAVTNQLLSPNIFSQQVTVTDPVLPSTNRYRIDLTFTISAN
jgi:hypothetical protein